MDALVMEGGALPPSRPLELRRDYNSKQIAATLANIEVNLSRPHREFLQPSPGIRNESFVVIGGGPSLARMAPRIFGLQRDGARIAAMNDAASWCCEKGIVPWACVIWEAVPLASSLAMFHLPDDMLFLLDSHTHPDTVCQLLHKRWKFWHSWQGIGEEEIICRHDPEPMLIGGGCSAALRSVVMGYALGYRKFHLFGLDSAYGETSHAYYDRLKEIGRSLFRVQCVDKEYLVSTYLATQARDYAEQIPVMETMGCRFVVHGDGLIPDMARALGHIVIN